MKKEFSTKVFLNGKRVKISECEKIKGFKKKHNFLKNLCFIPNGSVSSEYILSTGEKLEIVVKNNKKFDGWD